MTESVDILCRVVDNYGDIGVVWRLAKALAALRPSLAIRIVCDHPEVFHQLWPAIDPDLLVQQLEIFTVIHWDHPWDGFRADPPRRVIEAFACGRPPHYESVLFDPADPVRRQHLVLEYLSAEPYTAEFHLLPSLSPVPQVSKVFFMPGFIAGTGGLIHDPAFLARRNQARAVAETRADRLAALGIDLPADAGAMTWFCLFSYEHDYTRLLSDLAGWQTASADPVLVLVAAGRSALSFRTAWEGAGQSIQAVFLPFLSQEGWDEVLVSADLGIVRGEESLARAALAGQPFIWHAYLQDAGYQRVKVEALIDAMAPCFGGPDEAPAFAAWRDLMLAFNERTEDSHSLPAAENWACFLAEQEKLRPGFAAFAEKLENLGDCAANLLSLMDDFG